LSDLLSNLPIARKLFLASVIPALTVLLLSVLTYRTVTTFSDDEGQLNDIYYSQRLASEYLRLVVDLETGFRGFVLTSQEHYSVSLSNRSGPCAEHRQDAGSAGLRL
jgi:CHASE3 domain sensor protein